MRRRAALGLGLASALVIALGAAAVMSEGSPATAPRDRAIAPWGAGAGGTGAGGHIVALGTSLTAGNGWPDRLQARLADCLQADITVTRVAEAGRGSAWGLTQVARVADLAPDVVLVEFAINDADLRDGVSRRDGLGQHRALIAELRAALPEATLVLMTMSPAYGLRGALRPRLGGHYDAVAALAAEEELGLVDLYPRWRAAGLPRPADGLHPDDSATAQVIDPVLTPALAQAWRGDAAGDCTP